jgi:hypothetical protein
MGLVFSDWPRACGRGGMIWQVYAAYRLLASSGRLDLEHVDYRGHGYIK